MLFETEKSGDVASDFIEPAGLFWLTGRDCSVRREKCFYVLFSRYKV